MGATKIPLSVSWEEDRLLLLDQTRLPGEIVIEEQTSVEQVWHAIKELKVRGAPAIGIAAAYGVLVGVDPSSGEDLSADIRSRIDYLATSRPTAVNLFWALQRMGKKLDDCQGLGNAEIRAGLLGEAEKIHREDREICRRIGELGRPLITENMNILTHCNAGSLAVSELGTALAPIYLASREGTDLHVYADETRPLLQGARLTSWELQQAGIPVTLLCDNMAAHLFSLGRVDMVLVGTDRVTANGDVVNKIGTLNLAILANHYSIPFYVACPSSTVDMTIGSGSEVTIEERSAEEVRHIAGVATAPDEVDVFNPAFDVTPAALVTGLITDRGILRAPLQASLAEAFS
jgi:methylthioribose-1-phosphate isomerase|tara:strand:+ start:8910 stop:9950 length:1041 start_codon:yes stop_codon:yes gene_type:complete